MNGQEHGHIYLVIYLQVGTRELTSSFLKQSGMYPDMDPEIYSRKNLDPEISSRGAKRVHT